MVYVNSGRLDSNQRPQRPERCALTGLSYAPRRGARLSGSGADVKRSTAMRHACTLAWQRYSNVTTLEPPFTSRRLLPFTRSVGSACAVSKRLGATGNRGTARASSPRLASFWTIQRCHTKQARPVWRYYQEATLGRLSRSLANYCGSALGGTGPSVQDHHLHWDAQRPA